MRTTSPVVPSPIFAGPLLLGPQDICLAQFRTQLHINSFRLTVMIGDPRPVLCALRFEHNVLRQQLGPKYLGIALGGSLARGLGTAKTSDVNYFIYTRSLEAGLADRIKDGSWKRLRDARLTPGPGHPVCDLEPRAIDDRALNSALSVFAHQVTGTPDRASLEAAALALIGRALAEAKVPAPVLLRSLMESFIELSGSSPAYAAEKFMKNRAREFIPAGQAKSLAADQAFMKQLRAAALKYMVERLRNPNCRFPKQVWDLFQ
jgi:hypothetical protein